MLARSDDRPREDNGEVDMFDLPADREAERRPNETSERRRVVRTARERLTSTTGTRPAFDRELAKTYAQNRLSGALVTPVLVIAIASAVSIWLQPAAAFVWLVTALSSHCLVVLAARAFMRSDPESSTRKWTRAFIAVEFVNSCGWVLLVPLLDHLAVDPATTGIVSLLSTLVGVALATMMASSVPAAVVAGTMPISLVVMTIFAAKGEPAAGAVALMTAGAQVYFLVLANRLYRNSLETLQTRAEKDALIGELEQAKANSDEARRRAEEANLAKSRFLATMSHELRTPLNAILGFSEVMKSEIFGAHITPTYKEYAGDIHDSGQHLLELINEILDLSRIEAGRYELNEESVRLTYVIEDCHHLLKLRAKNRGITIRETFEPRLPPVWADERALRQITLNLLSNAIKFTPQGGEIQIKVGWTASGGQYVSVADNGPGIPEDEIPTVLASFGQGSLAMKTAEQGAGLGLPIVKGLVDLHGGVFSLTSKLREGTEAVVTLPATRVMSPLPRVPGKGEPARDRAEKPSGSLLRAG